MRPLGIPTVRDRTVQTALRMVLEPIFERDLTGHDPHGRSAGLSPLLRNSSAIFSRSSS
jgi:retron-type reverse transcriptase